MPELTRLDRTKSTMRYWPPNGTAGLARSFVSGYRRVPLPPASTNDRTRSCMIRTYSQKVHFSILRFQVGEAGAAVFSPRAMDACPSPAGLLRIRALRRVPSLYALVDRKSTRL